MRLALVLMGGGARAAYQAGVLKGLAEIAHDVDPKRRTSPFSVICGSSAGAINATSLASHADDFEHGVRRLLEFWEQLRAERVYRTDWLGIAAAGARWLAAMSIGWAARRSPRGLLDNAPLAYLLRRELDFHRIELMLEARKLHALSVTALSYSSGRHLTFYQASEPIQAWRRAERTARMVDLSAEHLLASSAIPFVFPAVPLVLDGQIEYFGDGSIRQIAPLSPAIHFGSDRIVVVGAADPRPEVPAANGNGRGYPSLAQIGQQVLASVFLDSIGADIERIDHVNRMIEHLPAYVEPESGWRHVDVLAIAPSERIELIASKHLKRLPLTVRGLLGAVGGNKPAGASFASYLLFEAEFTRELVELGYRDAHGQRERLAQWIASAERRGGPAERGPGAGTTDAGTGAGAHAARRTAT
ncbi:Patatin [Burkholderia pseudomallei]|uniref:patatin-like phospholipase family protein n=1 Tax=Burkholderia pseudomallei TaxID=28450 RepID=UPI0003D8F535|nr:patatin-like phospholipase family protein [Burkholderia pseudomallei]KGX79547.1 patatin-like phospholipase family protein [Burkholderia pseudomallei MSHR435]AHE35230.1 patatin-like phospholipase family protein [Burkholderia pseudomallei NAU20B-16]AHG34541.1 patatin-like phospholipase family protein [Burkholderia pseudomallei MSHR511]AHG68564.1 patatin-like phospholipase family protein [Burkholderia pseudomallei MSHR146]AJX23138.1 patatin-like phospholipase family protein [Burkholderia pseud